MLNIYIYKKLEGVQHLQVLNHYLGGNGIKVKRFGDEAIELLNKPFFNLVDDPDKADYLMLPHSYFHIVDKSYIVQFINLSQKYNKKIIIFSYGDSDEYIDVPNSIIFRTSQYGYKIQENEEIMPAIADDLLHDNQLTFRTKGDRPIVGFCGWAGFESPTRALREYLKLFILNLKSLWNLNYKAHKRGLMFRREAIKFLGLSALVLTNFIIRKSFSGNEKTIELDPEQARMEYIKNIKDSDFSLAIKGDGNFSIRFYEILSLGRIPIFVDTDSVLPLENIVRYDEFMVRVNYKNIKNIDKVISDFYKNLSSEDFIIMQKNAREAFDSYLRIDKYFDYVFLNKSSILFKRYD